MWGAQFYAPLVRGGSPVDWVRLTFEHLGPKLVAAGLVSAEDVTECLAHVADPGSWYVPPVMVTAWGRRP